MNITWSVICQEIFPYGIPKHSEWTSKDEIIKILNKIGSYPHKNHTFLPKGGGLDLIGASLSQEDNCIECHFSYPHILLPQKLTFESFENPIWNYFRLEANSLAPKVYEHEVIFYEELCEIDRLHYVDRSYWDADRYDDEPLPATARLVIRNVNAGSYVIFGKISPYNFNKNTYDARHNNMTSEEFRFYIESCIEKGWNN